MVIHACIPAFAWLNTELPKMWTAVLEVQQPLKLVAQNLQTAIFAPHFLGSDEFETDILDTAICISASPIPRLTYISSHLSLVMSKIILYMAGFSPSQQQKGRSSHCTVGDIIYQFWRFRIYWVPRYSARIASF